jgi:hypothetical protein
LFLLMTHALVVGITELADVVGLEPTEHAERVSHP